MKTKNAPTLYAYEDLTSEAKTKAEYDYASDYSLDHDRLDSSELNYANEFLHKNATKLNMLFTKSGELVSRD